MSRFLAVNVAFNDPTTGQPRVFVVGDTLPDWAADQVTNDAVFTVAVPSNPDPNPAPPMSGKGSGVDAWRAYANSIGVLCDDEANRSEIIAAVLDAHSDA